MSLERKFLLAYSAPAVNNYHRGYAGGIPKSHEVDYASLTLKMADTDNFLGIFNDNQKRTRLLHSLYSWAG